MHPPLALRFVQSASGLGDLPPTAAEVAVAGRSNVGKSSLINALGHHHDLARVSKTPGRTQLLNLFEVAARGTVVDLPGYGYAAVSRRTRATWSAMIETYLLERAGLVRVMVLVDGEIGPTPLDRQMLAWLRSHGVPLAVIATKQDKVKSQLRQRRKKELAEECELTPGDVLWVSASKGTGVDAVRASVAGWLATP